jgi:uncharacterized protein YggU (UPF0235/DUF167 family)
VLGQGYGRRPLPPCPRGRRDRRAGNAKGKPRPDRREEGQIRVYVTTVPEDGKANAAVQKILAKALGIPKSRLTLIRGQTSRDKVFRIG